MNIDCPALECIWAAMQQKSDCVLRLAGIGTLKCSSRILRRSSSQALRIVVLFVLELWERTKNMASDPSADLAQEDPQSHA